MNYLALLTVKPQPPPPYPTAGYFRLNHAKFGGELNQLAVPLYAHSPQRPGAALVAISKGRLCAFPHFMCREVRPAIWCKGLRYLTLHAFHPHSPAMINVTPTQLRRAADLQEKIQSLQEELGQLLGGEVTTPAETTEAPKKYKFSAAARAKMRKAQKARWAKIKGTAQAAKPAPKTKRKMSAKGLANIRAGVAKRMAAQGKPAHKPKRKFSAAGRAALSAAAKARWAKAKKAGKSRL